MIITCKFELVTCPPPVRPHSGSSFSRGREARTVLFKQDSNNKHKVTLRISHMVVKLS